MFLVHVATQLSFPLSQPDVRDYLGSAPEPLRRALQASKGLASFVVFHRALLKHAMLKRYGVC